MITYLPSWKFFRVVSTWSTNTIARDVTKEERLSYINSTIEKLKTPEKRISLYGLLVASMREFFEEMSLKTKALLNDKHIFELCDYALGKDHEVWVKLIKKMWLDYAEFKEQKLLEWLSHKRIKKSPQ